MIQKVRCLEYSLLIITTNTNKKKGFKWFVKVSKTKLVVKDIKPCVRMVLTERDGHIWRWRFTVTI
jgi:hypothetical protein